MTNVDFYPMPRKRQRGILRWILLALHLVPFAGIVFTYPQLETRFPQIFTDNMVRLGIPIWAGIIVLHLLIVSILDIREGIVFARQERKRAELYQTARRSKARGAFAVWQPPQDSTETG